MIFIYLIAPDQNYSLKYLLSKIAIKGEKGGRKRRIEILSKRIVQACPQTHATPIWVPFYNPGFTFKLSVTVSF